MTLNQEQLKEKLETELKEVDQRIKTALQLIEDLKAQRLQILGGIYVLNALLDQQNNNQTVTE
jgi:hypothetical protein